MSKALEFKINESGNAVLETGYGCLSLFKGYRIQLSDTQENLKNIGATNSAISHFDFVDGASTRYAKTRLIHMVALAQLHQAICNNAELIKLLKDNIGITEDFIEHLITEDLHKKTESAFNASNTLANIEKIDFNLLDFNKLNVELENVKHVESGIKGDSKMTVGIKDTSTYLFYDGSLKVWKLDFSELSEYLAFKNKQGLTLDNVERAQDLIISLVGFMEEYSTLHPSHKTNQELLKKSSIFD